MSLERKFYIICGHYGCGKSNFSMNLAIERARMGRKVMLLDLDLVNPYFLSSGYKSIDKIAFLIYNYCNCSIFGRKTSKTTV